MIGLMLLLAAMKGPADDQRCATPGEILQPLRDMIDSPEMASEVAQVYLNEVYGADLIRTELPLRASLRNGVWHVAGKALPPVSVGGVAEIDLCRSNGKVLRIFHQE